MTRVHLRAPITLLALSAVAALGLVVACPYDPPWWSECCECTCEGCDVEVDRVFAAEGDAVECWEECDEACVGLADEGCGASVHVTDCPVELCVEYVGLGEACDGEYDSSGAPTQICRYYFRECEDPYWACSGGICVES